MQIRAISDSYPAPARLVPSRSVLDLLHEKGNEVWSIAPDASVFAAIEMMAEKHVGALLVVRDGRLLGIISERDYARRVILQGRASRETEVETIMTTDVVTVSPGDTLERCMELMTSRRIRHLPVTERGRVTGVVSIGDVVRVTMARQEQLLDQLERYVSAG